MCIDVYDLYHVYSIHENHVNFLIKGSLDEKLPSYELLKMLKETDS